MIEGIEEIEKKIEGYSFWGEKKRELEGQGGEEGFI